MKSLEKQLLLKALCGYLPYGVKYKSNILGRENCIETMVAISDRKSKKHGYEGIFVNAESGGWDSIDDVKLYLRPMSSITEEEKEEIKAFGAELSSIGSIRFRIKEDENDGFEYGYQWLDILDFLNANHFDYRDLIPMGIALEAPEGMYNTKTE